MDQSQLRPGTIRGPVKLLVGRSVAGVFGVVERPTVSGCSGLLGVHPRASEDGNADGRGVRGACSEWEWTATALATYDCSMERGGSGLGGD